MVAAAARSNDVVCNVRTVKIAIMYVRTRILSFTVYAV